LDREILRQKGKGAGVFRSTIALTLGFICHFSSARNLGTFLLAKRRPPRFASLADFPTSIAFWRTP
jgi:hypothetical protein